MNNLCIIPSCKNSAKTSKDLGASYFSIRHDVRDDIYKAAQRDDIDYDAYMNGGYRNYKICHEHYSASEDYWYDIYGARRLRPGRGKPTRSLSGHQNREQVMQCQLSSTPKLSFKTLADCLIVVELSQHSIQLKFSDWIRITL